MTSVNPRTIFIVVICSFTVLHVVLAVSLPISGDEAYYWDASRHPEWSYFDQPGLVIWSMAPFRAVFGESRLAVRSPAILASLLMGVWMLGLVRRLGGGYREAAAGYAILHGAPLFFVGSFYCSTDVVMTSAYLAATWGAVAIADGERRAWYWTAAAVGLGFLAKYPGVLIMPAVGWAAFRGPARRHLRTPTPYLAALLGAALTAPEWIWGARHGWENLRFAMVGRHQDPAASLGYLIDYLAGTIALASPLLAIAAVVGWWRLRRREELRWQVARIAAAFPPLFFAVVALRSSASPHWAGPGLAVAIPLLALVSYRGRKTLVALGVASGVLLSMLVVVVVAIPETLLEANWSYPGRPDKISTDKLGAIVGNEEIARRVAAARSPGELVASESYSDVHLHAFLSGGELPTRLANITGGSHGLASLYWHTPESLRGRDFLFMTEKEDGIIEGLLPVFEEVTELDPIEIERAGKIVRTYRLFRCRNLENPEGVFTRLDGESRPNS
jgi:4-amino-4-deoxy-L-arabinose transferase-like glycosyltransferase